MKIDDLPQLLYIGDVPVESSYHGSALLYRLLQDYPPSKLFILEGNLITSQLERRLPDVKYQDIQVGKQRYLNTRFHDFVSSWLSLTAKSRAKSIDSLLDEFQPSAVLTVAHGYSWLTAAHYAATYNLPLHLIVHDDWPRLAGSLSGWIDREFGRVYRQAASRLCVSPYMAEEYEKRYNVPGNVLYPSRAKDVKIYPVEPERVIDRDNQLTVVFGGTVNSAGHVRCLQNLADCLQKFNGQLIIYGTLTSEQAIDSGLQSPNIQIRGLLPSEQFIGRIREEADILFVPMSFDSANQTNMQFGFPSKITDYTAAALPLLIYSPSYSSAVRWAAENPGVAEVVMSEEPEELTLALKRLHSKEHRACLAHMAVEKSSKYFSHTNVQSQFFDHLIKAL
jgi:hypothetical protein